MSPSPLSKWSRLLHKHGEVVPMVISSPRVSFRTNEPLGCPNSHLVSVEIVSREGNGVLPSRDLGREARMTERVLRNRGRVQKTVKHITTLAHALRDAGYQSSEPLLIQEPASDKQEDSAGSLIDYIRACSRVHRWVPINLVLRALLSHGLAARIPIDTELVRELFEDNDLFRWRYQDNTDGQILVGARLQIEAHLICD